MSFNLQHYYIYKLVFDFLTPYLYALHFQYKKRKTVLCTETLEFTLWL